MLKTLEDSARIATAQATFEAIMRNAASKTGSIHTGFQGGGRETVAYFVDELNFWVAIADSGNRYWNALGLGNPFDETVMIIAEVNPPKTGIDRRIGGLFVEDIAGKLYMAHRGRIGGGRAGIGKRAFVASLRKPMTRIVDGGPTSEVIIIGALDDPNLVVELARFTRNVAAFKDAAVSKATSPTQPEDKHHRQAPVSSKFFVPADNPDDWRPLLAKPKLQWKTGYSAKTLAHSWTEARGFPTEVRSTFDNSTIPELTGLKFLYGFPEFSVPLPGGRQPSQNDVFVLARGKDGLVTIAVEGKVAEPFDRPVSARFARPSAGQTVRLNYLCDLLGLDREAVGPIGYQLLHRTASAIIEARRVGARHAVMLVHSFSTSLEGFNDYSAFAALFGIEAQIGLTHNAADFDDLSLYLGWVVGNPEYLSR